MNARAPMMVVLALAAACTTVRQVHDPVTLEPSGKASRTRTEDALDYSIAIYIAAPPAIVWEVLTDAAGYTRWNSTIIELTGRIERDGEVELVSKVAPDRRFGLEVSAFDPPRAMVWEDGGGMFLGVRHFTLTPKDQGTILAMSETYSGFFLSSAEEEMPDFRANFEVFAADARQEAERRATAASP